MIVDLSHPMDPDIPMFPGLAPPEIEPVLSREASRAVYQDGVEFLIQKFSFAGNSGTYMDAPFHRYSDGNDLASLPIDRLCDLPGVVVAASAAAIDSDLVPDGIAGCAVLFRTGRDALWGTPDYLASNSGLTAAAAELLRDRGAVLVGIDTWNVDDVQDRTRPVHSILLAASIPVVENLCNLDRLPQRGFRFHAPVLPFRQGGANPVRAYAIVSDS